MVPREGRADLLTLAGFWLGRAGQPAAPRRGGLCCASRRLDDPVALPQESVDMNLGDLVQISDRAEGVDDRKTSIGFHWTPGPDEGRVLVDLGSQPVFHRATFAESRQVQFAWGVRHVRHCSCSARLVAVFTRGLSTSLEPSDGRR